MRKQLAVLFVVLISSVSMSAETPQEYDARLERELGAKDEAALVLWKQASVAREAARHEDAIRLYEQVYARVPDFVHALRRQSGEEMRAGRRDAALAHGRQAVQLDRSPENMASLALILMSTETMTPAELEEAKPLAREAANARPDDEFMQSILAAAGQQAQDITMIREATIRLESIAPKSVPTHMFRVMVAASEGDWQEADAALLRAKTFGMPLAEYESTRKALASAQPFYLRWWKPALIGLAIWFAGFGVMLLAGAVLSRIAMRAAKTTDDLSAKIRRLYRVVLGVSCAFYYASLPIVIAFVIAFTGGLIYATFAVGRVPIKLVIILVVLAGVSVWSMLKSLFVRRRDEDPGMRLDLAQEPKLRALLDDVAAKIGTRAVDNVYMTPGTEVAVMERGKGRKKERCLILGIAALDGLRLLPLKAILGHEYGHFSNEDTAGGAFALAVRSSLARTAIGLAEGGVDTWYNPAWWFVSGFHKLFLRISEGASRLQEVLADRFAVFAYGAAAFEEGLTHVVERGVRFDAHVDMTLKEVVDRQLPLANLYTYTPSATAEFISDRVE
ncbi:MAG TPA: M48 family metalloprotease, partial [Thermoanaerobaculia bacterium]